MNLKKENQRIKPRERGRERETERDRQRDRERDREREIPYFVVLILWPYKSECSRGRRWREHQCRS
jgi:hypothetical protein